MEDSEFQDPNSISKDKLVWPFWFSEGNLKRDFGKFIASWKSFTNGMDTKKHKGFGYKSSTLWNSDKNIGLALENLNENCL